MILLGKLRRCHFTLLIIHRIARQLQRGAEDGNDFIQNGVRTHAAVTGVQVEIQVLNKQRMAFCRLEPRMAVAGGNIIGLLPCVPHISNGTRGAFLLAAVAVVDAPIGIYNDRNGRFLLRNREQCQNCWL